MGQIVDISSVILELGLSSSITDEERGIISAAITKAEGAVKRYLKYDPVQRERTEYYPQATFTTQTFASFWETTDTHAYERRVSGASTDELQVKHIPIRDINSLRVDYDGRSGEIAGSFAASTEYTRGEDYWLNADGIDSDGNQICRDGIIRSFGSWPIEPGCVKIVYTAGYDREELSGQNTIVDASPIMDAVVDEAIRRAKKALVWKKSSTLGFTASPLMSESLGDYKYSLGSGSNSLIDRMFGGLYDLLPETKSKIEEFINFGWMLAG